MPEGLMSMTKVAEQRMPKGRMSMTNAAKQRLRQGRMSMTNVAEQRMPEGRMLREGYSTRVFVKFFTCGDCSIFTESSRNVYYEI